MFVHTYFHTRERERGRERESGREKESRRRARIQEFRMPRKTSSVSGKDVDTYQCQQSNTNNRPKQVISIR